jgi:hypothetical protein
MTYNRPAPLTRAQQAAFAAELPALRKEAKAIRAARWVVAKDERRRHLLPGLKERADACSARLAHWHGVLTVGQAIRAPVRLWDAWNKVKLAADLNDEEIAYLSGRSHE